MSNRTNDQQGISALGRACLRVQRQYRVKLQEASEDTSKSPATSALGYLKTQAYRLGRKLKEQSGFPSLGQNPFQMVILTILAEGPGLTKAQRNAARLIGHELQYADEHNVPTKYLVGFIHQVGGRKRIEQLRAAGRERIPASISNVTCDAKHRTVVTEPRHAIKRRHLVRPKARGKSRKSFSRK